MTAAHSGEHTGRSGPDTDIDLGADPEPEHYEVFLSYNGDDEVAVERVARRLRSRKVEPWLDQWHLVPGTRWQTGIPQGLARSASCAVFIGPSSLGAWEREEVDIAVDRATRESGFRVIPVLLPGLDPFDPRQLPPFLSTRTWVDLRQGVDDERGLQQLVQAIRGIPFGGGALRDEGGDDVCPFRGLSSFEEEQAAFYFGREGALQRLVELFRTGRMAAVVGPSGSGKSSLVKAGLVPRVRDGGLPGSDRWTVRVLRPGAEPVTTLGAALTSLADDTGMAATVDSLTTDPRTLHLGAALALRNAAPEGRLLLVVDQFEEIFTLCLDDRQRSAFLANLGYATSVPGGRVVTALTLRADFYPRLAAHPAFSQLVQNRQLLLGMPGPDGLRQAIEGPSRYVGLDIEAGLVETILEDVGTEPGTLPLLQQALLETWRNRSGNLLALEGYQRAGGVRRALAERADRTFVALTAAEQACAQRLFLRLVQPGTATEDTRRRITLGEIVGSDPDVRELTERVIRRFVHERLLTIGADPSSDEPWLEVAHEALIRAWPTLRGWIDADRAGLQLHRSLTAAAQDWHTRDRDESTLFRGRRLTETLEWSGEAPRWLSSVERAFLTASEELDVRVARARTRQLITAAVALVVVLVIVSTAALIAVGKAREATRQRDLATSGELSVRADVERDVDPARSVALALRAMDAAPTAQAEAALRQSTLAAHLTGVLRGHQGRVQSVAVSPDGVLIASGGDDGTVRLWRTAGGTPSGAVETRQGTIYSVRFSPDGRRIATAGRDGSVVVVDLDSGSMRPIVRVADVYATSIAFVSGDRVVAGFSDGSLRMVGLGDGSVQTRQADPTAVYGLAATRDGTGVAVAGASGAATIWTVDPFAVRLTLPDEGSRVANVAFGPTGDEVATAGEDGTVRRWTAADGRLLSTWPVSRQAVYSLAYSPDGRTVAATGEDGVVALWSVTGTVVATLRGHAGNVYDASFSPRERLLVSAGRDGTVRTWDPGDAVVVAAPATRGSFSRDGTRVVTGGTDGAVRVWRTGAVTPDAVLTGHRGPSWARFFPDGRRIVSCGEDGTVRVWDSAGPPQVLATHTGVVWVAAADPGGAEVASGGADGRVIATRLAGGSTVVGDGLGAIYDVAYSSDGTRLLAAGEQGNVYVWDLTGPPRPPLVLSGAQGAVFSAAFDPSGSRIVAAGADGTARTWDVGGPGASPGPVFGGHQGAIEAVAFSSDGSRIASAGIDGTVRMWDAATGRQLVTVTRHDGQAASVSVAPDGRHLLSVGESDGTVRTSDCPVCGPIEEVLTLARSRAIES